MSDQSFTTGYIQWTYSYSSSRSFKQFDDSDEQHRCANIAFFEEIIIRRV